MLSIEQIEAKLNTTLSEEKKKDIENLKEESLKGLRKNLTGQIFDQLLVLGRAPSQFASNKYYTTYWCICSCKEHPIIQVRGGNLTSGNTKSCGCKRRETMREIGKRSSHLDLLGQIFEDLTVIEDTKTRTSWNAEIWKCRCSCGNIKYVSTSELTTGRVRSCGHELRSRGAKKIESILQENNIPFVKEKCFQSCKFPDTNASARFDYYINDSFLLEYDGEQHFQELDSLFFKDSLEKRKAHDAFKNQWCKDNNIPLKRIPYTELSNISLESIMSDRYLIS